MGKGKGKDRTQERVIKAMTLEGRPVEFIDRVIGAGVMKDVYFSPDRSYVVAFYRTPADFQTKDRLQMITGRYAEGIFGQPGGAYWKDLFCWPTAILEHQGRLGLVAPAYAPHFYFEHGSKNGDQLGIKGKEKEGMWFASANNQNRFLDPRERGNWLSYLRIGLLISRAVRRLHAAGLAHSDLSYKNVLVDPAGSRANIIDVDGLVVPGRFPPDVVGTPDFIAPEVVMTSHLPAQDPQRKLPTINTDRHALAVLIYMYLFYRHPLRGGQIHDRDDVARDETLQMGERALWVENPRHAENRIQLSQVKPTQLPWADTTKIPYHIAGPYLRPLFESAFGEGLRSPSQRPTASDWEDALVKTIDLIQPCRNPACEQKWYVFDNSLAPRCPFCGSPYAGRLPVLNLYSARREGQFRPENHRLMVFSEQSLFPWHVNRNVSPNEKLGPEQKRRVGYFVPHEGNWWLVNERLPEMHDVTQHRPVPVGGKVELKNGLQLLFGRGGGDRLAVVQMVQGT